MTSSNHLDLMEVTWVSDKHQLKMETEKARWAGRQLMYLRLLRKGVGNLIAQQGPYGDFHRNLTKAVVLR